MAASCLLVAFGPPALDARPTGEVARAHVGALLVLELLGELRAIRKLLTSSKQE